LRHVIGFSEILEEELGKGNEANVHRLTEKIKSSAARMGRLIDELLDYSRLGRTDLKTGLISLNPIIEEVINEAADIIKERKITWQISSLPEVHADKTLMRLVLQNLINNSIKFTSKKEDAVIEIGFQKAENNDNVFFVKDNGAGFEMEFSDKLFGVFQRLHTAQEFEGSGIGLATVRRILKRLGGKVWAEAKNNEGATFYFTLPK
jgi:light-regulated signal transduction histidine kinase (bacteriophytochrome)